MMNIKAFAHSFAALNKKQAELEQKFLAKFDDLGAEIVAGRLIEVINVREVKSPNGRVEVDMQVYANVEGTEFIALGEIIVHRYQFSGYASEPEFVSVRIAKHFAMEASVPNESRMIVGDEHVMLILDGKCFPLMELHPSATERPGEIARVRAEHPEFDVVFNDSELAWPKSGEEN